jgi:hypothetical protein
MSETPQTLVGGSDTPASATTTSHFGHGHHHLHGHSGKRLRNFVRPDGRKVHIAHSPEEASKLRSTLSATNEKEDIDLVIHGSPEHVSTEILSRNTAIAIQAG